MKARSKLHPFEMFTVTVPIAPAARQVAPQVAPQVEKVLRAVQGEMPRGELMARVGIKDRMHFVREYLSPAIEAGLVEMTIPNKPNSRLQKYRLTDKGREALRLMREVTG